ncbi:MAG: hypothetical protein K6U87_13415 [Firmicutes bacterium]|nr:hypothetical protein [Bacillota bacterium]
MPTDMVPPPTGSTQTIPTATDATAAPGPLEFQQIMARGIFEEFRAEWDRHDRQLITLLASQLGPLAEAVHSMMEAAARLEAVVRDTKMSANNEGLWERLDERTEHLRHTVSQMYQEMRGTAERVANVQHHVASLDTRLGDVVSSLTKIQGTVENVDRTLVTVQGKVENMDRTLTKVQGTVEGLDKTVVTIRDGWLGIRGLTLTVLGGVVVGLVMLFVHWFISVHH